MTSAIPSTLRRAAGGLGLVLACHGAASAAVVTTEHATVCKATGDQPYAGLYFDPSGVTNVSGAAIEVICPVVRTQMPLPPSFTVWLDGYVPAGASLTCTLTSRNGWSVDARASASIPGGARFDTPIALPASAIGVFSSQFVTCLLPPNAALHDVEPSYSIL